VQKPFELAHYLLPEADEWTLDKIRISMDIKPETEQGRKYLKEHVDDERPLRLINTKSVDPHIPVVIDYYTAYPNPKTGTVETWPDGYGYDRLLARSLKPFLR
jgi:murein L,D-transpeptidase YcbB/YkuD